MKTLIAVLCFFGVVVGLLWTFREYMPGALLIAAVPIVGVAAVAAKIKKNAVEGWSLARGLGVIAAIPLTIFTLAAGAAPESQKPDYVFIISVALAIDIIFMIYASTKLYKAREHVAQMNRY